MAEPLLPRVTWRAIASRLGLVLASVFVTLGGVELGFRIFASDALPPWYGFGVYPDNPRGTFEPCPDGGPGYCVPTSPDTTSCMAPPAADGIAAVLVLGDSFAAAVGVRAVDTFARQLALPPGYQVHNCASPGFGLDQVRDAFTHHATRLVPEAIVYAMVLNDLPMPDATLVRVVDERGQVGVVNDFVHIRSRLLAAHASDGPLRSLLGHSRAFTWFARRWHAAQVARATESAYRHAYRPGPLRDAAFDSITAMAHRSRRFLVVLWPLFERLEAYPFEDLHAVIRAELAARGVAVLDLLDVFRGRDTASLVVHAFDHHPNEVAHRLAADALAPRLRELLERPRPD